MSDPIMRAKKAQKRFGPDMPPYAVISYADLQWLIDRVERLEKQMELLLLRGGKIPLRYFAKKNVDYFVEELNNARHLLENGAPE